MKRVGISNKLFRRILVPAMALVLAVDIGATCAVNYFAPSIDMVFGGAQSKMVNPEGSEGWLLDYYDRANEGTPAEAKAVSLKVAKQIGDEGIILLKNKNNALPLNADANVTVFGHSSVEPVYGGSGSGDTDLIQLPLVQHLKIPFRI